MKRTIFIAAALAVSIGCDGKNPLSPDGHSTGQNPAQNSVTPVDTVTSPPQQPDTQSDIIPRFEFIQAPSGSCLEMGRHTWVIQVNEEGDRLRDASFHDSKAGCAPTGRRAGGTFRVTELGANQFQYVWNGGQQCGRYQADIAIGNAVDGYTTIVGVVINTGVDCSPPPPPPCEELGTCPPPPPPPCVEECEPPRCEVVDAENHSVELPNSSAATELAYVNQFGNFIAAGKTNEGPSTSDGTYAVVLVKAGRLTYVFFNVEPGDSFLQEHGISHVSFFICEQELN